MGLNKEKCSFCKKQILVSSEREDTRSRFDLSSLVFACGRKKCLASRGVKKVSTISVLKKYRVEVSGKVFKSC